MSDTIVLLAAALAVVWVATRPPRERRRAVPLPLPLTEYVVSNRRTPLVPSPN